MDAAQLSKFRKLIVSKNLDYYLILTQDEHNSEYVSDADKRREYVTGFTGSAGTAIVGRNYCELATDGRYWLQAADQLGSDWVLRKEGHPGIIPWNKAISIRAKEEGAIVGVDPKLISHETASQMLANGTQLKAVEPNLVDKIWTSKPAEPSSPIFSLPLDKTGASSKSKIADLRFYISSKNRDAIVISALDQIAWLLNLRGSDIEYNPVFKSYCIVTLSEVRLYLNLGREVPELSSKIKVCDYDLLFKDVKDLSKAGMKIEVSSKSSWAIVLAAGENAVISDSEFIANAKAIKNKVEIEGARKAQLYCGVSIVKTLSWLNKELKADKEVTEYEVSEKLQSFRLSLPDFRGPSFETISSSGANAAIIHYTPSPNTCSYVNKNAVFLMDSGCQFLYGTTDTTRTCWFSDEECPSNIKRAYTLVLKGHLALANAQFPPRTSGYQLDALARQFLWHEGLDYVHSTGHGVGSYLNVHEGPVGIGPDAKRWGAELKVGCLISNEPGYYKPKEFGIRIESLIVVQPKNGNKTKNTDFLTFETITLVPFDRNLIDVHLLTNDEINSINSYHAHVKEKLEPLLSDEDLEYLLYHVSPL